jgi:hypothetical protein
MAEKKTRSYKADTLRQRAEEMAPGKNLPDTGKHGIAVHCSFACLRDIAHE